MRYETGDMMRELTSDEMNEVVGGFSTSETPSRKLTRLAHRLVWLLAVPLHSSSSRETAAISDGTAAVSLAAQSGDSGC